jgi:hypothetical protein
MKRSKRYDERRLWQLYSEWPPDIMAFRFTRQIDKWDRWRSDYSRAIDRLLSRPN